MDTKRKTRHKMYVDPVTFSCSLMTDRPNDELKIVKNGFGFDGDLNFVVVHMSIHLVDIIHFDICLIKNNNSNFIFSLSLQRQQIPTKIECKSSMCGWRFLHFNSNIFDR